MGFLGLILITLVLGFGTQAYIKSTYKKYSQTRIGLNATGADMARRMLNDNGLHNVQVRHVSGTLTDHYDPKTRTVNLSDGVFDGCNVAATAVACHECGHAVQHATNYAPMQWRTKLVPLANFGSSTWLILLLIGMLLNIMGLVTIAVILYSLAVLFQLVTLPVEFNASARALEYIKAGAGSGKRTSEKTANGCKTVLTAAALTYVASALTSVLQLLYYLSILNRR